jgi:hypothetical protein
MILLTSIIEKTGRYGFLLVSLCSMIGLKPFLDDLVERVLLTDIFFTVVLISGLYALDREPIAFRRACLLMVGIIILKMLYHTIGKMPYLHILQLTLIILFIIQMFFMVLKHIIVEQEVTADIVIGGACAFVLLGFIWAFAYYLLETVHPNSLKGANPLSDDPSDYIYYSFVTLTSVGYGDILAVSEKARGLAILEAIVGQLYLAIMVSRLVSLHISSNAPRR